MKRRSKAGGKAIKGLRPAPKHGNAPKKTLANSNAKNTEVAAERSRSTLERDNRSAEGHWSLDV
jgi:hypothetical protein